MLNQLIVTKKWVDIDTRGTSLHTLEHKETKIQSIQWTRQPCPSPQENESDSDIYVLCNLNSIMNSEHPFQCSSFNRERQAKDISSLYWEAREEVVNNPKF